MEASANVTREEFNTAIGDISAKMETLMTTMSQQSQGAGGTPLQVRIKEGLITRRTPEKHRTGNDTDPRHPWGVHRAKTPVVSLRPIM